MANERDRNVWDVIALPTNADLTSTQPREQSLCTNGAQECALGNTECNVALGTSLTGKATAVPVLVSMADVVSYSKYNGAPVENGGNEVEQRDRRVPKEPNVVIAVNGNNDGQSQVTRTERSIFEHINSNFRPVGVFLENKVRESTPRENGVHKSASETVVSSINNSLPLEGAKGSGESLGGTVEENNIFERVRINSYIDSLAAQATFAKEDNVRGFPFSEKLRRLTNVTKDIGSNMSTTVHPLKTNHNAATSGRSFRQIAPASTPHSRSVTNSVITRVVNGQFQSLGTQRKPEASRADSNVIFPSLTPVNYASSVSPTSGLNNSIVSPDKGSKCNIVRGVEIVNANGEIDRNSIKTRPNTVIKVRRIAGDESGANVHAQKNLVPTRLIGPFVRASPNAYVTAVRTTHAQPVTNCLPVAHQLQAVPSPLKGHSSSPGFHLVLPVLNHAGMVPSSVVSRATLPQPTSFQGNTLTDKTHNLTCAERLGASPDLLGERVFRPVSPAGGGFYVSSSPRLSREQIQCQPPSGLQSPLRAQRSIFRRTDMDRRGSVEEELVDQSYECALREAANSPDIERYLRCESPLTLMASPTSTLRNHSRDSNSTESCNGHVNCNSESKEIVIPSSPTETFQDFVSSEDPEATDFAESGKDSDTSKRKVHSAMVRRLEPRLPSPVRDERTGGDLYRDPSELTREERALQRAMMQFSEMEMKEKIKRSKKEGFLKRRLRKRDKDKTRTIVNGNKEETATKVWLKKFKRKRLWFSQRRSITVKQTAQEDNSSVKIAEDQQKKAVKRKRLDPSNGIQEQPHKRRRKSGGTDKQPVLAKPKDVSLAAEGSVNDKKEENEPPKVRRFLDTTRSLKKTKTKTKNVQENTSCKTASDTPGLDMGKRLVKRARVEIEPLRLKTQEVETPNSTGTPKGDKSHRVKTYMLVTAYQGFRDFKPVVLESRTRGKSRHSNEGSQEESPKAPEFPLLVVESVNSKTVKNSVIAENEEVQHFVENCLKARGKWQVDETKVEEGNDEDILKDARKLNVNRTTGETILHKAARLGYHETVHHHIHQGIDPNAKDNAGWTPLHEACSRGKTEVVKVLTKYGADVNACSNDGIRPIHDAAEGGHVDNLRLLLSYGADPLLATYSGNSALSCTKEPNSRSFLEGFLEDMDLKTFPTTTSDGEGCWEFRGSSSFLDESPDHTSGIFEGVPVGNSSLQGEFEMCDRPHLPTYNLPVMTGEDSTSGRRNYVLLSDVLEHLRIGRGALVKKAKKLDIREMSWSKFLAEIADRPLCIPPKYSPPDCTAQEGVAELVPVNYSLRRLLNIRVESVMMT